MGRSRARKLADLLRKSGTSSEFTVAADDGTSRLDVDADRTTVSNQLYIPSDTDAGLSSTDHPFQIGESSARNLRIDNNEVSVYNNGSTDTLKLNPDAGGEVTVNNTLALRGSKISTKSNFMYYGSDTDNNSSGNYGHLFFANVSNEDMASDTTPKGGFLNNDFYVQDNISAGRVYNADSTLVYNSDGTSSVTAYGSDTTTGYKCYTQITARNSNDADYGSVTVNSAYVANQSNDTSVNDHIAHIMTNGGQTYMWQSCYAGRTKRNDAGTTANYRAGDHNFTAYSNTGGTHGASTNKGFTQIAGRESANGDNVFRVYVAGSDRIHFFANGNGYFDGGADVGPADYAEFFEWADGNPDNEDRRGYPVVLCSEGKIRIATSDDAREDFLGIVSVDAAIVGDAAWAAWTGRYKKDKFGKREEEHYTMYGWGSKENEEDTWEHYHSPESALLNNVEIPENAVAELKSRPILADDYDPDREYIPRKDRQEWQAIGLMGKLPLLKGQPTAPQWRKLFDLNDEVEMWMVR